MGKGIEVDVLSIPAAQLQPSDEFWVKGQRFTVWSVEELEPDLIRVSGEERNYQASILLDARYIFPAVFRQVGTIEFTPETETGDTRA